MQKPATVMLTVPGARVGRPIGPAASYVFGYAVGPNIAHARGLKHSRWPGNHVCCSSRQRS
jgi:hypothetical protein